MICDQCKEPADKLYGFHAAGGFGQRLCGTCAQDIHDEHQAEESAKQHEAEQRAPGVVVMQDLNDEFPF